MKTIPFRNINKETSSDKSDLYYLIEQLDEKILLWTKSDFYKNEVLNNDNLDEDYYTQILISYLFQINSLNRFLFISQAKQPNRRTVDIGISLKFHQEIKYIFCIEAKFLPPKDYVSAEYAAIKRYKKCEHGVSSPNPKKTNPLPENGIIAYMKKDNFKTHQDKINQKITALSKNGKDKFNLVWTKSEQLQNTELEYKFISNHPRTNAPDVKLHHFWVKVS